MIDIDEYTGRPRVDSTSGIILGRKLVKHAPRERSARLNGAIEEVRERTVNVQGVWQERSRFVPLDQRPFDKRFDNGWGGLYWMLGGLARFEGAEIVDLTDAIVVPYIRTAQADLADVLGLGPSDGERANTRAMADALDALSESIARYVRILAGETDERDPASLAIFEKAVVGPLDEHRAYHRKQTSGVKPDPIADEDKPDQPIPPLPAI